MVLGCDFYYFSLDGIFPGLRYFLDLDFRSTTVAKPEKVILLAGSGAGKQADSDFVLLPSCKYTISSLSYPGFQLIWVLFSKALSK